MRVLVGVLAAVAVMVAGGCGGSAPGRTEVVRWSPFDAAGMVKASLKVTDAPGACWDIGYTYVGGIGYRCESGHILYDACFRDGPTLTEFVICIGRPWETTVVRLRSPNLLLWPGVTFIAAADRPWGIVLDDGNRCGIVQGAHDRLTAHGKRYTVDYECTRGNLVLLREGLTHGTIWHANAARWNEATSKYSFLGEQPLRRVYFGALPPLMARQNALAHQAYLAAKKVIHESAPHARLFAGLAWVRVTLPDADWAYVMFISEDVLGRGWSAVLHRVDGHWQDASAYKPYCTKLPVEVRGQLFAAKNTRSSVPSYGLGPYHETRC